MSERKNKKTKTNNDTSPPENINTNPEYEDITIDSDPDIDWADDEDLNIDNDISDDNEDCIYNDVHVPRVKKSSILTHNNDSDNESDDDTNEYKHDSNIYVNPDDRCSSNILTKYEVVRILCERTTQLSSGAKPLLNGVNGLPARTIAQLELESKMIPFKVVRPLPNGLKEIWDIDELHLKDIHNVYGFKGGKVNKESILSRTSLSSLTDTLY
jgi:DNA-directed RNA polymerase subunit K/omega